MSQSIRRRGYSLFECLVLITVLSALIGLSAGTIHLLLKLDRAGRTASEEAVALARLARDFRDDIHEAPPADPPGRSPDRIVLPLSDSKTVEYTIRPGDVLRTVRQGEKVLRHETYRRPARASVRIDVESDGPRLIASMVIDRPSSDRDISPYRDYRIEAELGKHGRLKPRSE
jgi:hypothetical protein